MILRRFSQHVREQNWFAVGLDLFVVIIGIFLGFQLTEWNQARKDRALEKQYLVRMLADVDESLTRFQGSLMRLERANAASARVARTLFDKKLTADRREEFEKDWGLMYSGAVLRFISSTMEELRDAGRMDLVQSDSLRIEIGAYLAGLDWRYSEERRLSEALDDLYSGLALRVIHSPSPENRLVSSSEELTADRKIYQVVHTIAILKAMLWSNGRDLERRTKLLRRVVAAAVEDSGMQP